MIITRRVFSAGSHHVTVVVTDARGVSAEARMDYVLPEQDRNQAEPADVPPLYLEFVRDTPQIVGRTIEAEFVLSRPATSITCSVRGLTQQECASGSVRFTSLPVRDNTLVVSASNGGGDRVVERVSFVIADVTTCSVHLINRGLTSEEGSATVEFTGIGQFTSISCSIDGASYSHVRVQRSLLMLELGSTA